MWYFQFGLNHQFGSSQILSCNFMDFFLFQWIPDGLKGECGVPTILSNLLAGKVTKSGEYPYMAVIEYENRNQKCSGSLINDYYILTAAHCVKDRKIK